MQELSRVNFGEDFWDCYYGQGKNGQWLTAASINDPRSSAPIASSLLK